MVKSGKEIKKQSEEIMQGSRTTLMTQFLELSKFKIIIIKILTAILKIHNTQE